MKPPRRWKDSPDAPVGVRELLVNARATRPLDRETLDRGARRVGAIGSLPLAAALWPKLAAAAAVSVGALAVVVGARALLPAGDPLGTPTPGAPTPSSAHHANPANAATPDDAPQPDAPPVLPVLPPLSIARTAPTTRTAPVAAAAEPAVIPSPNEPTVTPEPPAAEPSSLAAELRLLEEARSKLTRDPVTCLERLAEHRARYPSGTLAVERDLLELDALRRTGRTDEARARARAWLLLDPSGIHAARVRAILASLDDGGAQAP